MRVRVRRTRPSTPARASIGLVVMGLVSGLALTVLPLAPGQAAEAAAPVVRDISLLRACVGGDDVLRAARSGCRPGERAVRLTVGHRLTVCLGQDRAVRVVGRKACRRADGTVRTIPDNTRLFLCAQGRDLGWRDRRSACGRQDDVYRVRNRAPRLFGISGRALDENAPAGTVVGSFSASDPDPDDVISFRLVAGAGDDDNAKVRVVGDHLVSAAPLDFEQVQKLRVRVQVRDLLGRAHARRVTATITDQRDHAPTAISLTGAAVAENRPAGTLVGSLATTDADPGDSHTYTLTGGGADDADFVIDGDRLRTSRALDHETASTRTIRVRSVDSAGLSVVQDLAVTVTDEDEAPTAVRLDPDEVAEDAAVGDLVGTLVADDPDGGSSTATFALAAGGADNAAFNIVDDELRVADALDHEDADTLAIRVRATDASGLDVVSDLTVKVTDVNEAPTGATLTPSTVAENRPGDTEVGTLAALDPDEGDSATFALAAGPGDGDNDAFDVDGDALLTTRSLDFEDQAAYSVRVRVTDAGGLSADQVLTVTATDANDAPTGISISDDQVAENSPADALVGTLSTTDEDAGDSHTYSVVTRADQSGHGLFAVDGDDLVVAGPLDAEGTNPLAVRVRTTDAAGATYETDLEITVTDVTEAPTAVGLADDTVPENAGTVLVGAFTVADPDGSAPYSYTLVAGAGDSDNAAFTVDGGSLRAARSFDFETEATLSVRVRVTNAASLSFTDSITIHVQDVNDAPTDLALAGTSVAENRPAGTAVGTLSTTDQDGGDSHTYALVTGAGDDDNARVSVVGDALVTTGPLDHEADPTLSVRVRSTDEAGATAAKTLTITVTDENDAPTGATLGDSSVPENSPAGTTVGTLAASDQDAGDTAVFALVGGTGDDGNGVFDISGDTLVTDESLDHEAQDTYSIRVQVTDAAGASAQTVLTVHVADVNEAPGQPSLDGSGEVDEAQPAGTVVGALSASDPDDGDSLGYSLSGPDAGRFAVSGSSLVTAEPLDHESDDSLSLTLTVTDSGGLTAQRAITVTVLDVNEAPSVVDDSYAGVVGNTQARLGSVATTGPTVVLTGALPLANDSDQDQGDTISVVPAIDLATSAGGRIDIAADGTFVYRPQAGDKSQTDTATYTVRDAAGLTSTGTISLEIGSRLVWYVDDSAASGGNGTSSAPYSSLAPLQGASDPDGSGEEIFLYAGSYGGIALEAGQRMIGQPVGLAPGLVAAGGAATVSASSGAAVTLANGVTVDGVTVSATGTARGVSGVSVTSATLTAATAIAATGSGAAFELSGTASGDVAVRGPISSTGPGVSVQHRAGGTVTFSGSITSSGAGVTLGTGSGSTVFEGGLAITSGAQPGFSASSAGTVTVTGGANTIATTTGTGLDVVSTTIGSAGLTFRSISVNGAARGIRLDSTGTAAGLTVTGSTGASCGTGVTADCTGGTLASTSGDAVSLRQTHAASLSRMRIVDSGGDGIAATALTGGLRLADSLVTGAGDADDENGVDVGDSAAATPVAGTGTVTITGSTISGSANDNVYYGSATGSGGLEVSGSRLADAGSAGTQNKGLLVESAGTSQRSVSVTGSTFGGNRGAHLDVLSSGGVLDRVVVRGNTFTGDTPGAVGQGVIVRAAATAWSGTVRYDIDGNQIAGAVESAIVVSATNLVGGATFSGYVRNNTVGNGLARSCSETADGIVVTNQGQSGTLVARVANNTVRNCYYRGISLDAGGASSPGGSASLQATVANNTVSDLVESDPVNAAASHGLHANLGLTANDTATGCLDLSGNSLAKGPFGVGANLRHRYGSLALPSYAQASDPAPVRTYLAGRNPATPIADIAVGALQPGGSYVNGGAACTQPDF